MDYEQKYKEALERAKKLHKDAITLQLEQDIKDYETIFPELKESEDERMIKFIKQQLFNIKKTITENYELDTKLTKAIDWLEKQGDKDKLIKELGEYKVKYTQEVLSQQLRKQGKQKSTDKIEPKFRVGDWLIFDENHNSIYQVERIDNYRYYLRHYLGGTLSVHFDNELIRLWTIQDAKNGDVLQLGEVTAIFEEFIGNGNCCCYCSVCNGEFEIPSQDGVDDSYGCHNAKPATKEQRDTLMKAMADAGYAFDF